MQKQVQKEVKSLIKKLQLNCNIKEFKDKVKWINISAYQKLSEDFIREFKDKVNWSYISMYQKLSEDFIREFKDYVDWEYISFHQSLSEDFIREFKDVVNWINISAFQNLSEDFIREFKDKVNWYSISFNQKLSEDFIREFKDKVNWNYISYHQSLSEDFIREFKDKVNWYYISRYQKLSEDFIKEFNIELPKTCWLYKTDKEKLEYVKEHKLNKVYEIGKDYLVAYKSVREDYYSVYNWHYHYEIGKTYESHCDCNVYNENSFGLAAWTKDKALEYHRGRLLKIKIYLKDLGCFVQEDNKIRCRKLTVIGEEKI